MDALGIERELCADHARRVVIVFGAAQPPDALPVKYLDFERTGRRAIMRAGRSPDFERGWLADDLVHSPTMPSDSMFVRKFFRSRRVCDQRCVQHMLVLPVLQPPAKRDHKYRAESGRPK